jgi:hypothetical protein
MSSNLPTPTATMTVIEAYEELEDMVRLFHNERLRAGPREQTPREWARDFRSWLDEYEFERRCAANAEFMREVKETEHDQHPADR